MSNESEQVEQDLKRFAEYPLDLGSPLTQYGAALLLLGEARQDAKDWMTRYHIEKEVAANTETQRANIMREMRSLTARCERAERKARLLANVIATLIDSEEFV